jgi:hypothetical protein
MDSAIMKIMFSINNYFQVFNRIGPQYGVLEKFVNTDYYVGFPE